MTGPAARRSIIRGAIECAIRLAPGTRERQTGRLTAAVWRVVEPALAQRDAQLAAVHDILTAMEGTTGARLWAGQLRTALRPQQELPSTDPMPGLPLSWCGASETGVGAEPLGPCVLRAGHDGPVHQAANGARWWPVDELSPDTIDPEPPDVAGIWDDLMRIYGGPLPAGPPRLCLCGAQRFAGRIVHNADCPWRHDPAPLRALASQTLDENGPGTRPRPTLDEAIDVLAEEIARQAVEGNGTGEMRGILNADVKRSGPPVPVASAQWGDEHAAEQPPLAACRRMETRTCPAAYNGPCGERPCARFESDDPTPWTD